MLAENNRNRIQSPGSSPALPLAAFFTLAYVIGWGPILPLAWMAQSAGMESWIELSSRAESGELIAGNLPYPAWFVYSITRLQDFAFSISGLIVIILLQGQAGLRQLGSRLLAWRLSGRCWLVVIAPLLLYLLATSTSGALSSFEWSRLQAGPILFSLETGLLVTLFLRGPMGEELGLRGFALPQLQAIMSPSQASMLIGLLWAGWHLPVLLGRDPLSIAVFLLAAFLLSFVFTWMFNNSGGSLVPGLLFHTFQNNEETFEIMFAELAGTDWELVSTLGLLVTGILLALSVKRRSSSVENIAQLVPGRP